MLTTKYLHNPAVRDWIWKSGMFTDILPGKKNSPEIEWGKELTGKGVQWTTELSETLIEEYYKKRGINIWRPKTISGFRPDWETDDFMIEVKCRNWTTSGTAGEKILGTPYKYADVPELYGKPLKIILVAYQEYEARIKFRLLSDCGVSKNRKLMRNTWKNMGIEFVGMTDLMELL